MGKYHSLTIERAIDGLEGLMPPGWVYEIGNYPVPHKYWVNIIGPEGEDSQHSVHMEYGDSIIEAVDKASDWVGRGLDNFAAAIFRKLDA